MSIFEGRWEDDYIYCANAALDNINKFVKQIYSLTFKILPDIEKNIYASRSRRKTNPLRSFEEKNN